MLQNGRAVQQLEVVLWHPILQVKAKVIVLNRVAHEVMTVALLCVSLSICLKIRVHQEVRVDMRTVVMLWYSMLVLMLRLVMGVMHRVVHYLV